MSQARKQSIISVTAWLFVSIGLATVFVRNGPEAFAGEDQRGARLLAANIILPGYLLNFGILIWARRGRRRGELDERDKAVERRASEATLTIVLLAVFLASVALFEHYREAGAVPAGWLYLLAYGTMALVSFVHPAASLILDLSGRADG